MSLGSSAARALAQEFKSLLEEPVEGFRVKLVSDENMFNWEVAIFGPPDTIYQGGYFKASMEFPSDYPYSPPSFRFLTKFWHPNVYGDGKLCISILHPPVDDPRSDELPSEQWNPTRNVKTILLSVVSLMTVPNISSPANVDASVMFRRWKESNGKEDEYEKIVSKQVEESKAIAQEEGVVVPTTIEEYINCTPKKEKQEDFDEDILSFFDYNSDDDGEVGEDNEDCSDDDHGEVDEDDEDCSVDDGGEVDEDDEDCSDDDGGEVDENDEDCSDDDGGEVDENDEDCSDDDGGEVDEDDGDCSVDDGGEVDEDDEDCSVDDGGEVDEDDEDCSDDENGYIFVPGARTM